MYTLATLKHKQAFRWDFLQRFGSSSGQRARLQLCQSEFESMLKSIVLVGQLFARTKRNKKEACNGSFFSKLIQKSTQAIVKMGLFFFIFVFLQKI